MPSLGILARADTHRLFYGISLAFQLSVVQFNSMFLDITSFGRTYQGTVLRAGLLLRPGFAKLVLKSDFLERKYARTYTLLGPNKCQAVKVYTLTITTATELF